MMFMLYNNKDIMKKYKTRYKLKKAIDDKEIYKLDNGIYSDEDLVDPMIVASKKLLLWIQHFIIMI